VHDASADFLHLVSGLAPSAGDVDGFFKDLPPGRATTTSSRSASTPPNA
jgi:hypothetical protein